MSTEVGRPLPRRRARGRERPRAYRVVRHFAQVVLPVTLHLEVEGVDNVPVRGPVLLAGNHAGLLDGPVIFATVSRPVNFLIKSELYVAGLARAFGWLGQVPIHRGRPDRAALRAALRVLEEGGAVGLFPEGTRGTGEVDRVQHGVAYLAIRARCPIVPVALAGTGRGNRKRPRGSLGRRHVRIVFGPPLTPTVDGDPRSRRTIAAVADQIRVCLRDHVQETLLGDHVRESLPESSGEREGELSR